MTLIIDKKMRTPAYSGMITPYIPNQVRLASDCKRKIISYGQSSAGYDIRMGMAAQLFVAGGRGNPIDPKEFDTSLLQEMKLYVDDTGQWFHLPPHSSVLTHSIEYFDIRPDVAVTCIGKSTYARCGLIVNVTPLEPAWQGYLTMEIVNTTPSWLKVYAGEGIAQLLFWQLDDVPAVTYADRGGKYQGQAAEVVTAIA